MKNIFKYIGLVGISLCSFYYTEKVALYVKNKNPIMQSINEVKDDLYVSSINSTLVDELYIIPGISGREVNVNKTFNNSKNLEELEDDYVIYDQIAPEISIENNKERVIIRGNESKNKVSFIFDEVNELTQYMHQKNYRVNLLIKEEKYDLNYELINDSKNEITYKNIDKFLDKNNINKNLCYVKDNSREICKDKYKFKESLTINHSNISTEKNNISSGEIILIQNTLSLTELNILINQIKYQDLQIVPLSELISETN